MTTFWIAQKNNSGIKIYIFENLLNASLRDEYISRRQISMSKFSSQIEKLIQPLDFQRATGGAYHFEPRLREF